MVANAHFSVISYYAQISEVYQICSFRNTDLFLFSSIVMWWITFGLKTTHTYFFFQSMNWENLAFVLLNRYLDVSEVNNIDQYSGTVYIFLHCLFFLIIFYPLPFSVDFLNSCVIDELRDWHSNFLKKIDASVRSVLWWTLGVVLIVRTDMFPCVYHGVTVFFRL